MQAVVCCFATAIRSPTVSVVPEAVVSFDAQRCYSGIAIQLSYCEYYMLPIKYNVSRNAAVTYNSINESYEPWVRLG